MARAELDVLLGSRAKLLPAVAARVGLSARTLQRRLAEAGVEFMAIVDAVRRRRALQLVAARRVGLAQVARAVGYVDERAFRAAFLRWTGHTPSAYRRRMRAGDALPNRRADAVAAARACR